jgi:hypothetical protein
VSKPAPPAAAATGSGRRLHTLACGSSDRRASERSPAARRCDRPRRGSGFAVRIWLAALPQANGCGRPPPRRPAPAAANALSLTIGWTRRVKRLSERMIAPAGSTIWATVSIVRPHQRTAALHVPGSPLHTMNILQIRLSGQVSPR